MHLQLLQLVSFLLVCGFAALWFISKRNSHPTWRRARPWLGASMLMAISLSVAIVIEPSAGLMAVAGTIDLTKIERGLEKLSDDIIERMSKSEEAIKTLKTTIATVEKQNEELQANLSSARRAFISGGGGGVRHYGRISDQYALKLGALFVLGNAKSGRLDLLEPRERDALYNEARGALGIEQRTALTTTDIPLPSEFTGELRELIQDFGVARRHMSRYPIGRGTAKPPRWKTRPAFGSIAMSAAVPEKSPQIEFASLESHKIGGIVRVPREIDEQSIVQMGRYLARYGAVEFARAEDTWAFLADGSGTYESVKGICKIALDNAKIVTTVAGILSPSEVTTAHIRAMRGLVNPAALNKGARYYFHSTMEAHFRSLNTATDPYFFVPQNVSTRDAILGPGFTATLDGFPIEWTDVFPAYTTSDVAVNTNLGAFGVLEYWYFGEHGNPRMDFSADVFFGTDELATRFIEEIDFDYADLGATSALRVAAS